MLMGGIGACTQRKSVISREACAADSSRSQQWHGTINANDIKAPTAPPIATNQNSTTSLLSSQALLNSVA
jgi:hypothetical protein